MVPLQVQVEPTNKWRRAGVSATSAAVSKYTGVVQAFKEIIKDEGVAVSFPHSLLTQQPPG